MRPTWPIPSSSTARIGSWNRILTWTLAAWADYEYWQSQDRKTLKRVNALIKDCLRHPFEGIGKPEPLRENLSGIWSRRIDDIHRFVYCVDDQALVVIACRYHY
ncbi:MAG: Txe/YoeB family addiction module toxin [Methylococcaceae bacterium]